MKIIDNLIAFRLRLGCEKRPPGLFLCGTEDLKKLEFIVRVANFIIVERSRAK